MGGMGRPRLPDVVIRRAYGAMARGATWPEAAAAAGISVSTLASRLAEEPGVVLRERHYRRGALTSASGRRSGWASTGESDAAMAGRLGRHRGRVGREIAANGGRDRYRAVAAQDRADQTARRPKRGWTQTRPGLWQEVQALLRTKKWSPEQIARRLRRDHPDGPQWWVSPEAIYQAVFVQAKGELRKELAACLRSGRARRRPHGRVSPGRAPRSWAWSTSPSGRPRPTTGPCPVTGKVT